MAAINFGLIHLTTLYINSPKYINQRKTGDIICFISLISPLLNGFRDFEVLHTMQLLYQLSYAPISLK